MYKVEVNKKEHEKTRSFSSKVYTKLINIIWSNAIDEKIKINIIRRVFNKIGRYNNQTVVPNIQQYYCWTNIILKDKMEDPHTSTRI